MNRTECAMCKETNFETINDFPQFPIMSICSNEAKDIYYNYCQILCRNCSCLQLRNLVDPSIIYSTSYMTASFSPSWTTYFTKLANFIIENTESSSFLEIGANKGDLFKILSNKRNLQYAVLDMYKHASLPSEVKFLEGNCESFDFTGINTIILSHVFEHLYRPSNFVEQLAKSKVNEIFISNPNFDFCLENDFFNTIYSQHTFYCGFDHMIYLFSLYNYKCQVFYEYNGSVKSQMYKFVYDPFTKPKVPPHIDSQIYKNIYVNKVKKIQDLEIPERSFICPSGIYGQSLYYFINNKKNILGFIDNDLQRQEKLLYGTQKMVYSPRRVDLTNSTVLLCSSTYNNEIIAGLKEICPTVNIIIV